MNNINNNKSRIQELKKSMSTIILDIDYNTAKYNDDGTDGIYIVKLKPKWQNKYTGSHVLAFRHLINIEHKIKEYISRCSCDSCVLKDSRIKLSPIKRMVRRYKLSHKNKYSPVAFKKREHYEYYRKINHRLAIHDNKFITSNKYIKPVERKK